MYNMLLPDVINPVYNPVNTGTSEFLTVIASQGPLHRALSSSDLL